MALIVTSIELGLLFGLVTLSVFLSFRILHFPDLTVDGSFVTGAAVAAIAIRLGMPGSVSVACGFIAGGIAGTGTALLHVRFGISNILSGILMLGALYTINLRIMGGPNVSLLRAKHVLPWLQTPMNHTVTIALLLCVAIASKLAIDWFLRTEYGLLLRATGENEATARSLSTNTDRMKFVGLALANAFVGMAGSFVAQYQGFVDVNMGIGMIILGLASLMLGEAFARKASVAWLTSFALFGSVLYQFIVNLALRAGLAATDLKLVTATIVVLSLVLGRSRSTWKRLS